jgi:hypothetical protein
MAAVDVELQRKHETSEIAILTSWGRGRSPGATNRFWTTPVSSIWNRFVYTWFRDTMTWKRECIFLTSYPAAYF